MRTQILIGLAIAVIAVYSFTQNHEGFELIKASRAAELGYSPQISNEWEIKVTATLQTITNDVNTWDVEVAMETHTKALNDDLTKSAVLVAQGKQYLPSGWAGAPPGGHHRNGRLSFKAIAPRPASVELQIRLENDPAPRIFKWLLN